MQKVAKISEVGHAVLQGYAVSKGYVLGMLPGKPRRIRIRWFRLPTRLYAVDYWMAGIGKGYTADDK